MQEQEEQTSTVCVKITQILCCPEEPDFVWVVLNFV